MSLPLEAPLTLIIVPWMIGAVKYAVDSFSPTSSLLNMVVYDTR